MFYIPVLSGRHLVAKQGETWQEMGENFADEVFLSYSSGFFKGKGKAVPLSAMRALGGRGGIAPTHSRPRH
jgi:hypothetical protein